MTVRVSIVGVWHVHAGEYVDELLAHPEFEVAGVWDSNQDAARAFATERGLSVLDSFNAAVAEGIDGIVVCSETTAHVELISTALRAGKHVFTEKVLTGDVQSARELEELAAESGRSLFVSLQRLAEPWIYEMMDVIASGEIGQITSSRFRYQHGGVTEGWLPDAFMNQEEAGGGSIIDLGAHGYYLSNLFHKAFPESLVASAHSFTGARVEDHSVVVLNYPGGVTSVLETSLIAGPYSRWCEVYGTQGFAVVDTRDDLVCVRRLADGNGAAWTPRENGPRRATPLVRWLASIEQGKPDAENVAAALRLTAQVEASYVAATTGARTHLSDPAE